MDKRHAVRTPKVLWYRFIWKAAGARTAAQGAVYGSQVRLPLRRWLHECQAVLAGEIRRNNWTRRAWLRSHSWIRIGGCQHRATFRKIPLSHKRGGNCGHSCAGCADAAPLLGPKEEQLLLAAAGQNRAAEVVPEIVEFQHAHSGGEEVARVQIVVADELISSAVICLSAGAHLEDKLAARATAVFGHIARGDDIDFTDGINARSRNHSAIGAGACGGRAFDEQVVRIAAHSVDVRALCRKQVHALKVVEGEFLDDSRLKRQQRGEVPPVNWDVLNLGVANDASDARLFGLNSLSLGRDGDDLRGFHCAGQLHGPCRI